MEEFSLLLVMPRLYGPAVPLVLLVILAASSAAYWLLVRRWTEQRQWMALANWAEVNGFRLEPQRTAIRPEALAIFGDPPPRVLVALHNDDTEIVQIQTQRAPNSAAGEGGKRWNLLIRRMESTWPTMGLRPAARPATVLDLLPLRGMYALMLGERFILYSTEMSPGQALGHSPAASLLPPDIAIVLSGHFLILDFSTRPFDPLEMQRIDTLAEQLVSRLPVLARGRST